MFWYLTQPRTSFWQLTVSECSSIQISYHGEYDCGKIIRRELQLCCTAAQYESFDEIGEVL